MTGQCSNTSSPLVSGEWLPTADVPRQLAPTDTRGVSNEGVVIMKGSILAYDGKTHFVVTVDPSAIDRKLAIRKLNDQIEGRSSLSETFADAFPRR